MVDLVKARKKAKQKKDDAAAVEAAALEASAPRPELPSAEPAEASSEPEEQIEPAGTGALQSGGEARLLPAESRLERYRSSLGQRRELRELALAAADEAQAAVEELELLLFTIEEEQYAVPIENLVEIIQPRMPTRVPNASDEVIGIISLRGTIVSILDVRRRLGHPARHSLDADDKIVVVQHERETAGFLVERVSRVVRIAPSQLESHPVVTASEQSEFIRAVFQHSRRLSILLDLERLLRY
jgi:purine-binding chemotaxis protein CheW